MNREASSLGRRLGRGSQRTREITARTRRFALRRELARRRRAAEALSPAPDLAIEPDRGFQTVPPGRLAVAGEAAAAAARIAQAAAAPGGARKKQQLLSGLLARESLTPDSPFLRLALAPELVAAASAYLGAVPVLTALDVWQSLPNEGLDNSQLFHCDWADLSQVKVFVHASDVQPRHGPLVVLGAATSKRLRERIGYRWSGPGYRVSDETVHDLVGDADRHELLGPPGSIALVDTCRCFHFGSRVAPGESRAVCVVQYLLPSAFSVPGDFLARGPFRALAEPGMPAVDRMVLGAD